MRSYNVTQTTATHREADGFYSAIAGYFTGRTLAHTASLNTTIPLGDML